MRGPGCFAPALSLEGSRQVTHQESTTIAILGGNPVVARALEILLRGVGYEVRFLGEPQAFEVEDLPEVVDVLLLGSDLSSEYREDFLGAMASALKTASIPILSFSLGLTGTLAGEERWLVEWPCRTEDLAKQIEAALLPAAE